MLEPDQWEDVLSKVTGTVYRGTERISSNALLNALKLVLIQSFGRRWRNASQPRGRGFPFRSRPT
jgi:hypothetical protein